MRDVRTCMPMKNILHVLLLVLGVALLLTACESGKKEADKANKTETSGVESAATASNATAPRPGNIPRSNSPTVGKVLSYTLAIRPCRSNKTALL